MARSRGWFLGLFLGTMLSSGCQPEVLIARHAPDGGDGGNGGNGASGGTTAPTAGTAGDGGMGATGNLGALGGASGSGGAGVTSHLLADSVADFALVQGERGWYYGYDTGSLDTFALLPRQSVVTTFVPPSGDMWKCWVTADPHWTQIFELGAHPNATETSAPSVPVLERPVRRWISTYAGNVRITGELAKIDVTEAGPGSSNGVEAFVLVDGELLYSKVIEGDDSAGESYEVRTSLQIDSTVDFVLDPYEDNDFHDLSRFTAVIERDL